MIMHVFTAHSPVLFHAAFGIRSPWASLALASESWPSRTRPSAMRVLPAVCPGPALPLLGDTSSVVTAIHLPHLHFTPSLLSQLVWSSRAGSSLQTWRQSENSRKEGSVPSKGTWHWLSTGPPSIWDHLLKDWCEDIVYIWMLGFTTRPSRTKNWVWGLSTLSTAHSSVPCIQCLSLMIIS